MSLELAPNNIEQNAILTPTTDRALDMVIEKTNMTEVDCVPLRRGLEMAGLGYAEVQTRYANSRIHDNAYEALHDIYLEKTQLHIPDAIKPELTIDDYEDILEEQAAKARNQAEFNILLSPDIPEITIDTVKPSDETIKKEKIKILSHELTEQTKLVAEKDDEIRALKYTIAALRSRLGEGEEIAGGADIEEDLDVYEKTSDMPQMKVGNTALRFAGVER
jgi:hypothetical protein